MKTVNKVILLGYVAGEPQEKVLENGTKYTIVLLKTRDFFGKPGERKVDKNYHRCIFWNSISEHVTEILKKDDVIHVIGKLKTKKIEKGDDFIYKTEVVVEDWTKVVNFEAEEDD